MFSQLRYHTVDMVDDPRFRTANLLPFKHKILLQKFFSHYLENGVYSETVFIFAIQSLLTKIRPSNLRNFFLLPLQFF